MAIPTMNIDSKASFSVTDYVILSLMLSLSAGIGIYYALTGGKQRTAREFLMADRQLPTLPVAMSLMASFMSGITYLGVPADVYFNGTMFVWFSLSHLISGFIVIRTFIPVFYRLGITSMFEYLELRFNKVVRRCVVIFFYTQQIIYLGIVVYAPCLAFSAITGTSFIGSLFAVGIVCIFYTTLGGMKAVVWADVFQMIIALMGFVAIIIKGSMDHGGFQEIINISARGGRIELLNFDPDPTVRHTFWTVVVGGTFLWLNSHGLIQYQVQRYMSCQSLQTCKRAFSLYIIGLVVITILACMCGLVTYAYFHDCDVYSSGQISRTDQVLPYLVIHIFRNLPGLPGLFLSAVFSAALSTLSSALNGLAAVTGEDIVKSIYPDICEKRYTMTIKFLAAMFGFVVIGMAFLADLLGKIMQTAIAICGVMGGPTLGIFSLGMFVAKANSKGALVGFTCGISFGLWIIIGSLIYPPIATKLPLSTEGCQSDVLNYTSEIKEFTTIQYEITTTVDALQLEKHINSTRPAIADLYSLSYVYYNLVTCVTTIIVGIITSLLTGSAPPPDGKLMSPLVETFCCSLPSNLITRGKRRHGKHGKGSKPTEDIYWKQDAAAMAPLGQNPDDITDTYM